MSDYPPTESILTATYAGLGSTYADVHERYLAATQVIADIKAGAGAVAGESSDAMRERVARAITPGESWWIWRDVGLESQPLKARAKLRKQFREMADRAIEVMDREK